MTRDERAAKRAQRLKEDIATKSQEPGPGRGPATGGRACQT